MSERFVWKVIPQNLSSNTGGLSFTSSTMMVRMIRSAAKSRRHAHKGHKEIPRFRPPWWCKTLLLHVWDCSNVDDHSELTSFWGFRMADPFYGALAST